MKLRFGERTQVTLCRLASLVLLASVVLNGQAPAIAESAAGGFTLEADVSYPFYPCRWGGIFDYCEGNILGSADGLLYGSEEGNAWKVSFSGIDFSGTFSYRGELFCNSVISSSSGTGSVQGVAEGTFGLEQVTGINIDMSFNWTRVLSYTSASSLQMLIDASITLLPQGIVVQEQRVFIPYGGGIGAGVMVTDHDPSHICHDPFLSPPNHEVVYKLHGVFIPLKEDSTYGMNSLLIFTENDEGEERVWNCGTEAHFAAGATPTVSPGWHAHGTVWCGPRDDPNATSTVPHLGVTIQWRDDQNDPLKDPVTNEDSGECIGSSLREQLLDNPQNVGDTLDEVIGAVEDENFPYNVPCHSYYQESWRDCSVPSYPCGDGCSNTSIADCRGEFIMRDIRMSISIPEYWRITNVTTSTVDATKPLKQPYCTAATQQTVECHYEYLYAKQAGD